ncbi:MAG TPA: DHA2 family efflux MFS transporter permease subunit [Ktedonobacterales bacterium]|nr:DHA2 family efflux MFS transporter permease subunit [Ktedonobacterales bacterium]
MAASTVPTVPPASTSTPVGATRAQRSPTPRWTVALTSVAFFMVSLDALVVLTALPAIHRDLGASLSTLEWTINAYTLAYAAGIITAAALGDRFGRRRMFAIGLTLFSLASAACALAPNVGLLIAFRVAQGLGAAIIIPLSLTILTAAFPPARRGAIVGLWGGIGGLAVAGGPLVGGAITQGLDWHWIFWVNVPIGLVAAVLAVFRLAESHGPATRLDLPAVALVSGGVCSLVWGLVHASDQGWGDAGTLVALGLGVILLSAFVAWEQRAPEPMLPLRLFRSQSFSAANITGFLMSGALFGAAFLVTQYFQLGLGFSPLATGLRLLPWTATPIVVAPAAGLLSDRVGRRPVMVVGMLLQGIGLLWVGLVATPGVAYGSLIAPLLIAGVGVSMALATTSTAVLNAVRPQDLGKASGANSTLQRFGSVFGVALASAVFAAHGHLGAPASFDAGFRPALMVVAVLSLLGVASAAAIGSLRRRAPATTQTAPAVMGAAPTR